MRVAAGKGSRSDALASARSQPKSGRAARKTPDGWNFCALPKHGASAIDKALAQWANKLAEAEHTEDVAAARGVVSGGGMGRVLPARGVRHWHGAWCTGRMSWCSGQNTLNIWWRRATWCMGVVCVLSKVEGPAGRGAVRGLCSSARRGAWRLMGRLSSTSCILAYASRKPHSHMLPTAPLGLPSLPWHPAPFRLWRRCKRRRQLQ